MKITGSKLIRVGDWGGYPLLEDTDTMLQYIDFGIEYRSVGKVVDFSDALGEFDRLVDDLIGFKGAVNDK